MAGTDSDKVVRESRPGLISPLPPFSGPSAVTAASATTGGGSRLGLLYVPSVRPIRSSAGDVPAHEGDATVTSLEDNVHEAHKTTADSGLAALTDVDYRGGAPSERSIETVPEEESEAIAATQDGLLEAWTGSVAQLSPVAVESDSDSRREPAGPGAVPGKGDSPSASTAPAMKPSRQEIESAMSTAAEAIGRLAEGMLAAPFMVPSDQPPMVGPEAAELAAAREYRRRETVAEMMEELAQRIREGDIPLSTLQEGAGDAVTLAEVLAAMLRNAR